MTKKFFKMLTCIAVFVSMIGFTFGCTNIQKQNALYEYSQSLNSDLVQWQAAQYTSDMLTQITDTKQFLTHISTLISSMDKIVASAEKRNAAITDQEIKVIDDYYVQYTKDMQNCFILMKEGVEEYDNSKINASNQLAESALVNMNNYLTGLQDFMDKYEIASDQDLNLVQQMFAK